MSALDPTPVRVIGIGASAGGLEPMLEVLAPLPEDFPHALLVVLHVSAHSQSLLAEILDRRCSVRVMAARDTMPIRAGHVYVAPPDRHLTMRRAAIALTTGPQENGVRPAVDPLLRSIADARGPAAVGVVLSGALADGAFGARAIAVAGGRVLIQDPTEALVASMPLHAIQAAGDCAEVLSAAQIGAELARLGPPPEIAVRPLAGARI